MPDFNDSQRAAIAAENRNILVSAAAGSGKTTVMVEKIRETLIRQPDTSISQFLVITFTRDAAQNMKDKLRTLLELSAEEGEKAAARALDEMETASISTIHSFCTQLLKEYNDNVRISMNPRVLKDTERKRMLDECFAEAVENLLGGERSAPLQDKKAVSDLLIAFSMDELMKMVQDLYNVLMGIPEPFTFLERIVKEPPCELWNREIIRATGLDILEVMVCLEREDELMQSPLALSDYETIVEKDWSALEELSEKFERAESPQAKRDVLNAAASCMGRAPSIRGLDEETKAWKKEIDDLRKKIKSPDGILAKAENRLASMMDEKNDRINDLIRRELCGLELLLRETAALYENRKAEEGTIDYADMEQIAYRIMSDPDKRDELLARYRFVYVDECQDVSGIQDAIIKSLTGPGHQFFMVGDIKQSIYAFRHAEPDLFEQERRTYSDDDNAEERRIFFMDNYRSCTNVVDAVNMVFAEAMDRNVTDMDYLPEDRLHCNVNEDYGPVDVVLVKKGDEEADKLEAQCEAVCRYIQSLVLPAGEISSACRWQYRDIVILVRSAKGSASVIVDHLKKMQIPAMYEGATDFFGLAEVRSFLCLLTVIDNFHHDDALVGCLISFPFCFEESDLAEIRLQKQEHVPFYEAFELCVRRNEKQIDRKCRMVYDRLESWREISETMAVPDFVWWLMRDTGIYAARGSYPDGKSRQSNLDALYQRALDGQKAGNLRLSDFIRDLMESRETRQSDSDDHPSMGVDDNFVRIMTMHKSKGLEFPVVILMDLQKSLRRKRNDETLRMNVSSSDDALGLYLPAVRRLQNSTMDSQGKDAFETRVLRRSIAEDTRLLYVAMTRARQKLCLVGSVRDGDETLWMVKNRSARIWKTRSMLDMVMPAALKGLGLPELGGSVENKTWRITCVSGKAIEERENMEKTDSEALKRILTGDACESMYIPSVVEQSPLKTSVSTLTRQKPVLSEEDSEETVEDKRKTENAVRTIRLSTVMSRPAFLEEETENAVNSGTATHRFLRLIDLAVFRQGKTDTAQLVRMEAEHMKKEGIMTEEEAGRVRLYGVTAFLESDLGRRMLKSGKVHREATFTMRMEENSPTMVQGIVDCAFMEDGGWILIDYKTDRDTDPATFVPRHEMQMNWYRKALERITDTEVREMWLFALRTGKAYPVKRISV